MIAAENKLGVIFFPAYDWAIDATHPEREERLLYTQYQLREEGIFDIHGINELKFHAFFISKYCKYHY